MANLFRQIKQKWWDGDVIVGNGYLGFHTPWPRRFWQDHRTEIRKGVWTVIFTVFAAAIIKYLALN